MTKIKKRSSGASVKVSRVAKTGQYRVQPDKRDFRGGFQPRSTSLKMPQLPKAGSSVHVVVKPVKRKAKK